MALFKSWDSKFDRQADFSREQLANEQAFTERMWNQTNDWNLAQWNRENEYNSPSAQMERMAMAGINPNDAAAAIAGNDSSSGSAMASVPGSPGTPGSPNPSDDTVGLASQIIGIGSDVYQYLDSGKELVQAQANESESAAKEHDSNTYLNNTVRYEALKAEVDKSLYQLSYIMPEEYKNIIADTDKKLADKLFTDAGTKKINQEVINLVQDLKNLKAREREIKQNIQESKQRIAKINKEMSLMTTEEEKNRATTELIGIEQGLKTMETNLTENKSAQEGAVATYMNKMSSAGIDPRFIGNGKENLVKAGLVNVQNSQNKSKSNNSSSNWHKSGSTTMKKSDSGRGAVKVAKKVVNGVTGSNRRYRSKNHQNPNWH